MFPSESGAEISGKVLLSTLPNTAISVDPAVVVGPLPALLLERPLLMIEPEGVHQWRHVRIRCGRRESQQFLHQFTRLLGLRRSAPTSTGGGGT